MAQVKKSKARPTAKRSSMPATSLPESGHSTLVVVESPAKVKTIGKYLDNNHVVLASKGHIKDLPKRGGVDFDHGFQETYEVIAEKGKSEALKAITSQAKRAEKVYLATDPDREGEAIAWHIKEEIEKSGSKAEIRRVLFNEITEKGILEGIAQPRDLDVNLYEAQRTRRVLDRIGGYQVSNLLWRKLAFGLSAGRVQTPALRILVDQQTAIEAFVSRPYWLIQANLVGVQGKAFFALLDSIAGKKLERISSRPAVDNELDAKRYEAELQQAHYAVSSITKRERASRPGAPYNTAKLQQDAANRLGMQPSRTMRVAQALYEGVDIGKGKASETVGLITYMRTDSVRLSDEAVAECRRFIASKYGESLVPAKPNVFKSKGRSVQDAHEAIRPTRMDFPPDVIKPFLTDERYRLYKLIWDRFVACQMVPAVYDQTSVEIEAQGAERTFGLRVSGSVLKSPGWELVYGNGDKEPVAETDGEAAEQEDARVLPELSQGEKLKLRGEGIEVQAKKTEPPPNFTEASLVKKLEEEGIGRPSTYAEILSKVQARDYVRKLNNKLIPTELGRLVIERLVGNRFDLTDLDFTRKLEDDLDAVSEARAKRVDVLSPFHQRLQEKIEASLQVKGKWWPDPLPIGEVCPKCGKGLYKRWGRNGLFVGCEGYPECDFTRNIESPDASQSESKPAEPTDYKCDLCGAPMLKRWGRNGWFLGCSTFPKCKGTRSLPLGVRCPKCGGEIIEVRSRGKRRPFYGCTNYNATPKCDFRLWQRPVAESCPQCHAAFLVRAGNAQKPMLKCLTEGCDFQKAVEPAKSTTDADPAAQELSATGSEQAVS
jgi:DNA topoisomerase I